MLLSNYYIYPKGKNAQIIIDLFSFFEEQVSYSFIDDGYRDLSLECMAENIKSSNSIVLLASNRYKQQILNSLEKHNIKNYVDGIELYANKLHQYLVEYTNPDKVKVGIIMSGLANEKHFGNIDSYLLSFGYEIIYICLSLDIMRQNYARLQNKICIVANHDILKSIVFFDCIISTTAVSLKKDIFSINLTHAFCEPLSLPQFLNVNASECANSYANTTEYICASSKKTSSAMKLLFNTKEHPKVLNAGYPSLDNDIIEYGLIETTGLFEYVIFAVNIVPDIDFMTALIDGVSKIEKVLLFRPHPLYISSPEVVEIIELFKDNNYFKVDISPKLDFEIIRKSVTLITDYSSLGYTYPLLSLKPCIIYEKSECDTKRERDFESFYDDAIHCIAHSVYDILDLIVKIEIDMSYKNRILNYRQEQVFNLGKSEKYIAEFIKKEVNRLKGR